MATAVANIAYSALTTMGVSSITAATLTILYSQAATTLLVSLFVSALTARAAPSQKDLGRELSTPTSLPVYRFVYGETRATGSLIFHEVKDDYLYTCHLLNSRESEGNFTLFLDEREIVISGDAYDFSGSGGLATESPFLDHLQVWFGDGSQTTVPSDILADIPWSTENTEYLKSSDVGEGLTVVWLKLKAGKSATRNERWPSSPPSVVVEGEFSRVFDPTDVTQSFADKSTWKYSNDQTLCTLDALTQNPFQPYPIDYINLDQFKEAKPYSREMVTKKDGSTERRYTVNGTVAFTGSEIEDIMAPLFAAGASSPTNTAGKLGISTSKYQEPTYVVTDILEGFSYSNMKSREDLPTVLKVTYTSKERGYVESSLEPYSIAKDSDLGVDRTLDIELGLVTSATQAMRVRKIMGIRFLEEESLTCTAPPSAFNLIAGATTSLDLPAPFDRFNRSYTVLSCNPYVDLIGKDGVSIRNNLSLVSVSPNVDSWVAATEEEEVYFEEYDSSRPFVRPPSDIVVTTGEGIDRDNGGSIVPRYRVAFEPSPSSGVTVYKWRYRAGSDGYVNGAPIDFDNIDGSGKVFTYIDNIDPTENYDIKVSAVTSVGESEETVILDVTREFKFTSVSAIGGVGEVTFTMTTPTVNFKGVRTNINSVGGSYETATVVGSNQLYEGGTSITHTVSGQATGTYDYWVTPVALTGQLGNPSGPYTVTIT